MNYINIEFIFYKIYELVGLFNPPAIYRFILSWADAYRTVATVVSLVLIIGIVYCRRRINHINHVEHEKMHAAHEAMPATEATNKRWVRVVEHVSSDSESDWRLAVLEADIILSEMLQKMGYHGETISDMLKGVEKSDFSNIDKAWEAHKVRNLIAHEGVNFALSQREAKRVIGLFEEVFKEFHFI